jgi:hypothetical protein
MFSTKVWSKGGHTLLLKQLIILALLVSVPANCMSFGEGYMVKGFQPLLNASEEEKLAFYSAVDSFKLYSSFFGELYYLNDYLISQHGDTPEIILEYLSNGFNEDLAQDIIAAYTTWNPQLQKQIIIPCDGLPILTEDHFAEAEYFHPEKDFIIFKVILYDCYDPGDAYEFLVASEKTGDNWRIKSLRFDPLPRQGYEEDGSIGI